VEIKEGKGGRSALLHVGRLDRKVGLSNTNCQLETGPIIERGGRKLRGSDSWRKQTAKRRKD